MRAFLFGDNNEFLCGRLYSRPSYCPDPGVLAMINLIDDDNGRYGVLMPGKKHRVATLFASSLSETNHNETSNPFLTFIADSCKRKNSYATGVHAFEDCIHMRVPRRVNANWYRDRKSGNYYGTAYQDDTYSNFKLDSLNIENGYIVHTTRMDEPKDSHVRDHIYGVHLHGNITYRYGTDKIVVERNSQFGFTFDNYWRLARVPGDIRRVPVTAAEVEFIGVDVGGYMLVRVLCADGWKRVYIPKIADSWFMGDCPLESIIRVYDRFRHWNENVMLAKHVNMLMSKFGMSRRKAFQLLEVSKYDVFPVDHGGVWTYDNPDPLSDPELWNPDKFFLPAEPYIQGKVRDFDAAKFQAILPATAQVIQDIELLYNGAASPEEALPKATPYASVGREARHVVTGLYDVLKDRGIEAKCPDRAVDEIEHRLNWHDDYWGDNRRGDIDFCWMKDVGLIPFLPRIVPKFTYDMCDATKLASWRLKSTPVACFIMDKIRKQDFEFRKLEKALGEPLDRDKVISELEELVPNEDAEHAAVMIVGVTELVPLTWEKVKPKWLEMFKGMEGRP